MRHYIMLVIGIIMSRFKSAFLVMECNVFQQVCLVFFVRYFKFVT